MGRVYDATVGRWFTLWYGLGMRFVDARGLGEMRRQVISGAHGRTLEIGGGTGANLPLYPTGQISELVLAEPDPHMQRVLRRKVEALELPRTELVQAPAERLPFDDASFDSVVFTMVLCTIPEPAVALEELARVLKPDGKLLFLEHVRSRRPRLARLQDRLAGFWRFVADGCHCNRDSLATIESSFQVEEVEHGQMPASPWIVMPLVYGSARLSA